MASDWEVVSLSTIATVKSGKRLPLGETLTSQRTPHPYVRLVDIDNNRIRKENIQYLEPRVQKSISRYIVQKGDVCLAIVGHTIGLVFQVEEQWDGANLTENAARLTDFRGAEPAYIFSYLRSQFGQDLIKSHIVGSAQGKLPLYAIASFPIPLPPLAEQKAIAAVLGALDDKIELNRRMNATLEAMARALFQSWFVDFDPVRAKLDGRQPVGMDEVTAALFPGSFEDSEAGHIPTGWKPVRLPDAIEVNPRRTLKKDIVAPYLDMKNLPTQGHSAEEVIDRPKSCDSYDFNYINS
jgi:type I restriction enzyme S subunit